MSKKMPRSIPRALLDKQMTRIADQRAGNRKVGRPKEFEEKIYARVPVGTVARIEAVLGAAVGQGQFVREAVEAYLRIKEQQTPGRIHEMQDFEDTERAK